MRDRGVAWLGAWPSCPPPSPQLEAWQETTVPKPRRHLSVSNVGAAATKAAVTGKRAPRWTQSEVEQIARRAQHGACVDHVSLTEYGLAKPICVLRGQDRDQVVADALEALGIDPEVG